MHAGGSLDFDVHWASHGIMICVTPNVGNHDHVYCIDGIEGGLRRAVNALQTRLRASES